MQNESCNVRLMKIRVTRMKTVDIIIRCPYCTVMWMKTKNFSPLNWLKPLHCDKFSDSFGYMAVSNEHWRNGGIGSL